MAHATYDTFGLHQLVAVQGWHGVWWVDGQHVVQPIHLLALVTRTTRRVEDRTGDVFPWPTHTTEAEKREVVGMQFIDGGFQVCDETRTYCGLLAPDMMLADFEASPMCEHGKVTANVGSSQGAKQQTGEEAEHSTRPLP